MPRCNGSYIGIDANPNANTASGIWTVREAERFLRADKWPSTPTVPGAPTPTAGDEEVSLTWTAPTGGSTPTDYVVQYSSDSGSTWNTFSDGVSTATSATVTGLTNGTAYIFRIQAINALGEGPFGSASASVTPEPPVAASLLLHFDGSNGSTTFTDSSPNGITVTAYGGAEISTTESKFGGSSFYLNGTDAYLETASDSGLVLGSGDFTIDFWAWADAVSSTAFFWLRADTGEAQEGLLVGIDDGLDEGLLASSSGSAWEILNAGNVFGPAMTPETWHHIAVSRSGNNWYAFVDGVLVWTGTGSGTIYQPANGAWRIGGANASGGSLFASGYIDEFRVVTGTAVWTSAFTPPSAPY